MTDPKRDRSTRAEASRHGRDVLLPPYNPLPGARRRRRLKVALLGLALLGMVAIGYALGAVIL